MPATVKSLRKASSHTAKASKPVAKLEASLRPIAVKLEDTMHTRIKDLATARQRTAHWVMQEAISRYVAQEEKREQFRKDTLAAWEHYSATGEHVTAKDADAWLDQLGKGVDAELPACRV